MATESLSFDLIARDRASRAFNNVGKAAQRTESRMSAVGRTFGTVAKGLAVGFAAGATAAAFGLKKVYGEANEARKVTAQTRAVLKSTGRVANVSAKQIDKLATSISNKTGIDDEAIAVGENLLLTFTGIRNEVGKGNDIFNRATKTITDMSVALGQDMKSSAIQVGKALNDPVKGITALSRVGVSFTEQQKEQIKTLVESGRTLDAQKIILRELGKEFGGSARAAATPMEKLTTVLNNVAETVGTSLLPYIDAAATFLARHLPGAIKTADKFFRDRLIPAVREAADFIRTTFRRLRRVVEGALDRIDLGGLISNLREQAQNLVGPFIEGLTIGIRTGDWRPLGEALADAIGRAVQGAKNLSDAIQRWISSVDWMNAGKQAASIAVPFIVGFVNNLLNSFLETAKNNPIDMIVFITSLIPVGRAAGVLQKVFGKLPIVGPMLGALSKVGGALEGGVMRFILRPLGRVARFIGGALLEGFRTVFPRAGAVLTRELGLIGTRLGVFALNMLARGKRIVGKLVDGIRSQISLVGAQAALIVARILRPFARAGSFLVDAGRQVVAGLVSGIRGAAGAVVQAAKDLAGSLPGWVRKVLRISSPSKVMHQLGMFTAQGLADGIASGTGMVDKAIEKLTDRLDKVRSKISDLKQQMGTIRQSVGDAVRGALDIGSLRGGMGAFFDIKNAATTAKAFADALGQLVKRNFAPALIQQIAEAGPESGLQVARSLLNLTKGQRRQVNTAYAQIESAANRAGATVARATDIPGQIEHQRRVEDKLERLITIAKRERKATLVLKTDESTAKTVRRGTLALNF